MQTKSDSERKRSQRERTAKHREKMKERSAEQVAAAGQRRKEEFDAWRKQERLCLPGEREAFINAESVEDALQVAREFLVALNQPDVQVGESLIAVERRSVVAWVEVGCPLLNRNTLRLDMSVASVDGFTFNFDSRWVPIAGAHDLIDITTLPVIEIPAVRELPAVPTVDTPAPPPVWDDPALRQCSAEVRAMCKITQDAMDIEARKLSAKNLQRETEREIRLGVGYTYAE